MLATTEQSPLEHYRIGQNVKAFVLEVRRLPKGPALFVSRTHKGFLKRLFELEVPEIHSGTVEIRAIAREAGSRSKVAVGSRQEGLDPVGATVGQRGARVQSVVAELGGEKIDVIPWNDDPAAFVANALSPAQVLSVDIDTEHRIANVTVPERMLSLAIGREGQNARLAARLTGWRIDIRSDVSVAEAKAAEAAAQTAAGSRSTRPPEVAPPAVSRRGRRGEPARKPVAESSRKRASPRSPRSHRPRPPTTEASRRGQAPSRRRRPRPPPRRPNRTAEAMPRGSRGTPAKSSRARAPGRPPPRRWRRRRAPRSPPPSAVPTRSCVACRTARPKRELLRDRPYAGRQHRRRPHRPGERARRVRLPRRRVHRQLPSNAGRPAPGPSRPRSRAELADRAPCVGDRSHETSKEEPDGQE